jgi:hypothetical protein
MSRYHRQVQVLGVACTLLTLHAHGAEPARPAASASAAAAPQLAARDAIGATGQADPFVRRSWLAPPPPPPKPAPPPPPPPPPPPAPPPTAPALPFSVLGLMQTEPGQPTVLLMQGAELIVAKTGDEIAGKRYRVASITPTAIHFVYLALQQTQVLQVPGGAP